MERLNDTRASTDDRELRERLEQVQMELRVARATLATTKADVGRAELALRGAVAEATLRRDAAWARVQVLRDEKSALPARLDALDQRLAIKREEEGVLARGAALRDHYVDWNPEDRSNAVGNGFTVEQLKTLAWLVVAIVMFISGVLYAMKP